MRSLAANGGEKSPFRGRLSFLRGRPTGISFGHKWPQVDSDNKKTRSMSGSLEVLAEREGFAFSLSKFRLKQSFSITTITFLQHHFHRVLLSLTDFQPAV